MTTGIEKAKSIFLAAVEKYQPQQWPTYLDGACGDDVRLRAQVQQLLKAHADGSLPDAVGTTIGPYKLLQPVGEGGFGVVYMAEQQEPVRRTVALKIIKPGMDTKEVIARFEAERQALALMDHPHIAKVLDAGATADGRPYFVMELVKGVPVTEFCDKNNFSTRQRLELFTALCNAVQHAHQKGVIHRDLKPSNVMVTLHDGKPVAKVIDFGVSKAISQRLTEKTLFTRYGQMVGTPQYMSPEQAEMSGLDVDTRSDIYSLGVLLYELLTGTTPLEAKRLRAAGYAEMVRLICEEEAHTPSRRLSTLKERLSIVCQQRSTDEKRLHHQLQGDLDWIVMKALEKDRGRRYETASAFAEDVARHLNDEPVVASPPSASYRLRKFVRRKRALVLAGSAVLLALVVGVSASIAGFLQARHERNLALQARRLAEEARTDAEEQRAQAQRHGEQAQRERDEAQSQQQRAQSVLGLMKRMLSSASLSAGRPRDYTVRQMLDDFSETLEFQFDDQLEVGADIWFTVGEVYHSIEEIERAVQARQKGVELARVAYKEEPIKLEPHLLFLAYDLIGPTSIEMGFLRAKEAEQLLRETVRIHDRLREPPEHVIRDEVNARVLLGWSLMLQHRLSEAALVFEDAVDVQKRLTPGEEFAYVALANCWRWDNRDRLDEAIELFDRALPYLREAVTRSEQGELARRRRLHVHYALSMKSYALWEQGRVAEADDCLAEVLLATSSAKEYAIDVYVEGVCMRAWTLLGLGNREAAEDLLSGALQDCRDADKPRMETRILRTSAAICILDDDLNQAELLLRTASQLSVARFGPHHVHSIDARVRLAQHYELAGRLAEAESLYREAVNNLARLVEQSGRNPEWTIRLALAKVGSASTQREIRDLIDLLDEGRIGVARFRESLLGLALAKCHRRLGHFSEAIAALRSGLTETWATVDAIVPVYESLIGQRELIQLLSAHGTAPEVEAALREEIKSREQYLTATHPATLDAKVRFAAWLLDQDRPAEAKQLLDDCWRLAGHTRASTRRKRRATETAVRIEALAQDALPDGSGAGTRLSPARSIQ